MENFALRWRKKPSRAITPLLKKWVERSEKMRRLLGKLNPAQQQMVLKKLWRIRSASRRGQMEERRRLADYDRILWRRLGVHLTSELEKIIASHKGEMRVLDIGCGRGYALRDVKNLAAELRPKKKIVAEGITLNIPRGEKKIVKGKRWGKSDFPWVDELHIGVAETYPLKKNRYGLILSFEAMNYSINPAKVMERIFNSLEKGGYAFVSDLFLGIHADEIVHMLEMSGAKFTYVPDTYRGIYIFRKASESAVNLSRFVTRESFVPELMYKDQYGLQ